MGISNQRPAWNKRRKLVFINGGVHRADYTRYICAMILARAVFTAGRFPTFTAQSSTGEATARRQILADQNDTANARRQRASYEAKALASSVEPESTSRSASA